MGPRFASLLVASLLVCSAAVGPVAAADARLTLTDTTVTPATPTAGAPITAETTLRLSAGSDTPMTVEEVRVVDDGETLGTASDLGRLSPGETLDVPVSFTVSEADSYDLRVVAAGTDEDGEDVEASRPLRLGVEPGAPQVELDNPELVAGVDRSVSATVSNPTTAPLRDIELSGAGSDDNATIATLDAGASQTVNFSIQPDETGARTVNVTKRYTAPNGARLETVQSESVTVDEFAADIGVRASVAGSDAADQPGGGGGLPGLIGDGGGGLQPQSDSQRGSDAERVDVTVTNFGNTPVDDVVLTGQDGDGARLAAVGRFVVADAVEPGESATVTVDLASVRTDDVRFVASYETPAGEDESERVYGYNARQGQATLTGLDVTVADDGGVTIEGNLANVGDGELTGAVVAVEGSDGVRPDYPQRTYFIGTVDASGFAPFELTAQADGAEATNVTVRIDYAVDGEQRTERETVPLPSSGGVGGGDLPLGITLAVTLCLVGVAAATVYTRRYRDR